MRTLLLPPMLALLSGCGGTRIMESKPLTASSAVERAPLPGDRRAADAAAQKQLLNLHFSTEGRGMHLPPGFLRPFHATSWSGAVTPLVHERWGFNRQDGKVVGLFDVRYKDMTMGAAGCAACHSGKAAGRFYPGLGNKNFDVTQLGADLASAQPAYSAMTSFTGEKREVERSAIKFAQTVGEPTRGNLTQGMVPVSLIVGWFYQDAQSSNQPVTRGAVKVPALWGYSAKRKAGLFCDHLGESYPAGWAVLVELTAGQKPETVRNYMPQVDHAEEALMALMPAPYPFAIDQGLARHGAGVFAANCRECHGSYSRDADGLPLLRPPQWLPLDEIGTDADRLDLVTDDFRRTAERNSLHDLIKINPNYQRGYFAPRLEGIWARFPYLHNASVPNIAALLSPPAARPAVFSLKRAGERERFDEKLLGLTEPDDARERASLLKRGAKGERDVYDTRRLGHSNDGHDFGIDLSSADKKALIEYLKTL